MSAFQHRPRLWSANEEQVVMLMLKEGATATTVAARFEITRNAAIGRIARNPDLHQYVDRRPGPPKTVRVPRTHKPKKVPIVDIKPTIPEPPIEGPENPMPLIDTGRQFCKWPIRDDDTVLGGILCCGRRVGFEAVYCGRHARQARPH